MDGGGRLEVVNLCPDPDLGTLRFSKHRQRQLLISAVLPTVIAQVTSSLPMDEAKPI